MDVANTTVLLSLQEETRVVSIMLHRSYANMLISAEN